MKFLSRERLSQHKYKTPEGYLICVDSVLARTGKQTYHRDEVFHDGDDTEIEVDRHPDEVFSEQTLASFENKPITVEHPDCDVTCENYKDYAVGFVRDVKRGTIDGQDVILGTLVIQDAKTIDEIEAGEHIELSCGYDCDIKDEENPQQRNIRGNHVALCEQGRAGNARIVDTADEMYGLVKEPTVRYFLAKFFNEKWETDDNVAVIKAKNETEAENKLKRSGIKYDSIRELTHSEYIKFARLTKVIDSLKAFYTQRRGVIYVFVNYALVGKFSSKKDARDAGYDIDGAIKFNANHIVKDMEDSMKKYAEDKYGRRFTLEEIEKGKVKATNAGGKEKIFNSWKEVEEEFGRRGITIFDSFYDSIEDEISGAYKEWYNKIGYSADDEDALRRYRVEIMRSKDLTYVEADELLKRIDRFLPKKDAVEDETPYEEVTKNLNKKVDDAEDKLWKVRLTGGIDVNNIMYVKADTEAEARRIAEKNTKEDILKITEYGTDIATKRDKERILANPNRYFDSLKKFTVDVDGVTHVVKAKTVQDALKKVNDYRDLNAMTNAILQCNKDMASAKDKAVEYLACKSQLEDIVNQADPKVKEHWKTEKDDWLKAMKAKYHV